MFKEMETFPIIYDFVKDMYIHGVYDKIWTH